MANGAINIRAEAPGVAGAGHSIFIRGISTGFSPASSPGVGSGPSLCLFKGNVCQLFSGFFLFMFSNLLSFSFSSLVAERLFHLGVSLEQGSSTVAHWLPLHMGVAKSSLCIMFLQMLLFCLKNYGQMPLVE